MDKINFKNLPDTTTPINAENLNAIQDNTEIAINEIGDQLKNNLNYSTSEIKTDGKWIDGKPIYRKVIVKNNVDIRNGISFAHNIQNIDFVVNERTIYKSSETSPDYVTETIADTDGFLSFYVNRTNIKMVGTTYWQATTSRTWYFIVEYTKTTD